MLRATAVVGSLIEIQKLEIESRDFVMTPCSSVIDVVQLAEVYNCEMFLV